MADCLETARRWLEQNHEAALATVIETWGSAPVPVGGQLVIGPDGAFEGSVSGGCVEAEVVARAADVIADRKPQVLEFGVSDEAAWNVGLACGGRIRVFVEPVGAQERADRIDAVLDARSSRQAHVQLVDLADGGRRVLGRDEAGSLPAFSDHIQDCLRTGKSRVVRSGAPDEKELFLQAVVPQPRLIIVGATHIGQVLARLAHEVAFDVTVIDPRTAFATRERFGDTRILADWPEQAFKTFELDGRTAVACLTHESHIDDEALKAALGSACFYVGALGSRRTHEKRVGRLRDQGVGTDAIGRIRAPIGLNIGAATPTEIGVSIIAEIIAALRPAKA